MYYIGWCTFLTVHVFVNVCIAFVCLLDKFLVTNEGDFARGGGVFAALPTGVCVGVLLGSACITDRASRDIWYLVELGLGSVPFGV